MFAVSVAVALSLMWLCVGVPSSPRGGGVQHPLSGSVSEIVLYHFQGSCKGHGKEGSRLETEPKRCVVLVTLSSLGTVTSPGGPGIGGYIE